MTKRIFKAICFAAVLVFCSVSLVTLLGAYDYVSGAKLEELEEKIILISEGVDLNGAAYFEALDPQEFRITWIAADGTVLFESQAEPGQMENHLQRQEVQSALAQGQGYSRRYSATLGEQLLYCASRLKDGTVLRLADSQAGVVTLVMELLEPLLLTGLVLLALLLIMAAVMAKDIIRPLNRLDLDRPLENRDYPELQPLLSRIDSQQKQLWLQETALKRRQEEFRAATDNLQEGLILLNEHGAILSVNRAALRLLELSSGSEGRSLVSLRPDLALGILIARAKAGIHSEQRAVLRGGEYQINASPVYAQGVLCGVALLIFDVTEREKAEQMRREFTANVSHELKTPLHTISGSAELLKSGLVKPEDTARFAGHIYSEAQRLILLVEDIIRLSRMDEGAIEMQRTQVDLYGLAKKVLDTLSAAAEGAGVTLSLAGTPALLQGVPQLLEGLIYNLCDNGIKYNRLGGSLTVTVTDALEQVVLEVRDTGIGIPEEHRERIFERFYRVDKSHSKEVGGTGLGLSIVKHAAKLHRGQITMDSEPGRGTVITVTFPK